MSARLVLCYHAISPTWRAALSVRPEELDRQLTCLARRGWRGVTFDELVADRGQGKRLAVTFDDAFLSVLIHAKPVLDALGMPATVFAPTTFMAERQPLRWSGIAQWQDTADAHELQSMSWDDLRQLANHGWEIGAHTRTHPLLTRLDDATARAEVEQALGRACRTIAYPYGGVDDRIAALARELGYAAGASLSSSLRNRGPHCWPRVGVYHGDDFNRFRLKANRVTRAIRSTPLWPESDPAKSR